MKRKTIEAFLPERGRIPVLDVRSPGEYASGHLPGAHSLPLFTDWERAVIGTLYKQVGKQEAIKKGLDIVGPKMRSLVEGAEALGSEEIALYCWRGGMRSESVAWLLERYGFKTVVLEGGYKSFRREMGRFFTTPLPLVVLTGYTGSQKTNFLGLLRAEGAQVVDLEGLAGHQGSSFGNQKCIEQPTTEHFHNLVYEAMRGFDLHRPIWVEDESFSIGGVKLPEGLFQQMRRSSHVFLEVDRVDRIDFLVRDYGMLTREALIAGTEGITGRLGHRNATEAIQYIREGRLAEAVSIILTYYDKTYQRSIARKEQLIRAHYTVGQHELPELARKLAHEPFELVE